MDLPTTTPTEKTMEETACLQGIYALAEIQAYIMSLQADEEEEAKNHHHPQTLGWPTHYMGVAQPLLAHQLPVLKCYADEQLRVVLSWRPEDWPLYCAALKSGDEEVRLLNDFLIKVLLW